ncbi:MAG: ABC transporter ATP-binding protein [Actinobacteria bacterium]|nr:ABC transporter ATP-binding protein [Actinomycetota bacterium]MBM3713219.1 ABC transporter ATP-binding protein [Actinomycetota bacterium]
MDISESNNILEVKNLKTYFYTDNGVVKAVDGVSFDLKVMETLGIVGETGSGKSVTALSILRLIPQPSGKIVEGEVIFNGKNILDMNIKELQSFRGNRISMIFQDPMTSLNPVFTIGNQLMEAIVAHRKISKKEAIKESLRLLEIVGIPDIKKRFSGYPHEFSGGMRQRVMIAMAIANSPSVLIADEPTTALDVTIQAQILELIDDLKFKTNSSVIIITHDLGVVAKFADRVMVMYAGKPVEFSDVDTVFYKPCHPYTLGLIKSITRLDAEKKEKLKPIEGLPPSLIDLPEGCIFRVRCDYKIEKCKSLYPPFFEIEPKHYAACFRAEEFLNGNLSRGS